MVATKIQLLTAIGVALSVVQAGPVPITNNNHGGKPSFNNKAICTTPQCVLTAAGFLNDMEPLANPCEDFSKFTCGGFYDKVEIPAGKSSIDTADLMDNTMRILRSIVDPSLGKVPKAAPGDVAAQNNIKKLHDLFSSCMDEAAILKAGRKPLVDEIQKIIQYFPASESPASKATLSSTLGYLNKLGLRVTPLISLSVDADLNDTSINALYVYEAGWGMPQGDYKNPETVQHYADTMAAMFQVVLGEGDVANRSQPLTSKDVEKEWLDAAKEVVDFELQLLDIRTSLDDLYDPVKSNERRTIEELNTLTPSIDWSLVLKEAMPAGVNYTRPLVVPSLPFLPKLEVLLQKTSSKTLQQYFTWIVVKTLGFNLAKPYRQPLDTFDNIMAGISGEVKEELWKDCVNDVNRYLGHMAGHYYIQEAFKGDSRKEVMTIIDNIITSYERTFPVLEWLDKTTRDGAIKKLKAMAQVIGYSTVAPDVASSESLDSYFKDYTVDAGDYFGNLLRHPAWSAADAFSRLSLPIERLSMSLPPAIYNAYYHPLMNTINFMAGMLQMPMFHVENPEYVNYGGIGTVSGHEIGHAFDNSGRLYDATGRPINAFEEKSQCFVEQYGNFTVKGPDNKDYNVDGQLTLGENLADNGGIKMSFRIWQSRLKSDPNGRK
ncbi:hypothetical protein BGZ97_002554 [Linnemannia gamsii]|uniref:Zincin n=1 Tax=Linnemannia gamsii TaxID=64522 RepID=A0A9P6UIB0_9FUNG|nr:hypothetical protein BGZ97_002554 [Linnemannia gamsii]